MIKVVVNAHMFAALCVVAPYVALERRLWSGGDFKLRNTNLKKAIKRGKISLKSKQVMITIHYDPYFGQNQRTVKSSQNNVIVSYLCRAEITDSTAIAIFIAP